MDKEQGLIPGMRRYWRVGAVVAAHGRRTIAAPTLSGELSMIDHAGV